ncbi:NRDE family protein [Haladaptatus sp. AB643]|uniref:NRDE family protein n=1 Tax=unclassified Haladaptatus TaxID=2622732 RepID=UPI00209BD7A4|nr:NRDE family protein [Haladaptatus sp. AB643]MCO8254124.1 NRDE family protein [Haladaptatus sp. AB618]
MCTLIVAWQVFEDAPVVAAANRDEAFGRPSRLPRVLDRDPTVVAPQDEEAGGTWIGYNDSGLFVGVTNRWVELEGERSRGLLVRDALAHESAASAREFVTGELDEHRYAGFNLLLADANEATLLEWDGTLETTRFDPGVHVVVNRGFDANASKSERILPHVDVTVDDPPSLPEWRASAKDILRNHDIGVCVHGDGYGTRSSSIVTVFEDGTGSYEFADGPPCETPYDNVEGHI